MSDAAGSTSNSIMGWTTWRWPCPWLHPPAGWRLCPPMRRICCRGLWSATRGLALMPAYATNLLPWFVVSHPLEGEAPTIDLVIGYNKANTSQALKLFLPRMDELIADVSRELDDG